MFLFCSIRLCYLYSPLSIEEIVFLSIFSFSYNKFIISELSGEKEVRDEAE